MFDLLRHPRLLQLFLINAVVSLGWDIHTIFLPIYGTEIGLSSAEIGMALSSLAAATFVVRVTIGRIARRYSERQILMCALMLIAVTLPLLPLTRDPVVLIVLSFLIGLGLGTGQPMVMSLLHAHAPPGRLGEAAGVRISLIQSMSVAVPLVFGVVASSAGVLPVFWLAGICVGAGSIAVKRSREEK